MDAHKLRIEQGREAALCRYCVGSDVPANAMGTYYGCIYDTVWVGVPADGSSELVHHTLNEVPPCLPLLRLNFSRHR